MPKSPQPAAAPSFVVEEWPIDKVKPYENNARIISKEAVSKVADSIKNFGFQQAIVVDTKGVIIAGHTRLRAAQLLGMTTVPVKVATGLSAAKVKAYRLADNRTAEETKWDDGALAKELLSLGKESDALAALTGFNISEIDKLIASTPEHPPTDVIKKGAKEPLEPKPGLPATKGATKHVHTCPSCGHSWHSGDSGKQTKGKRPFGDVDEG